MRLERGLGMRAEEVRRAELSRRRLGGHLGMDGDDSQSGLGVG